MKNFFWHLYRKIVYSDPVEDNLSVTGLILKELRNAPEVHRELIRQLDQRREEIGY